MKITKRQLRRIIKEAMGAITPEAWADQNGLQLELDNEGQKIIYLDNEQADRLDMPPDARWDAIRNPIDDGWVIYTGEFHEEAGVWSDERDYEAGFKS
jgi:hypothetical protein